MEKRKRKKTHTGVERNRGEREAGNIFMLMFPFPQPQPAAIKPSILCPHKGHSSHRSPLPSKAKITQSSPDGRSLALKRAAASSSEPGTSTAPITEPRVTYQNTDVTPAGNNRRNGPD